MTTVRDRFLGAWLASWLEPLSCLEAPVAAARSLPPPVLPAASDPTESSQTPWQLRR